MRPSALVGTPMRVRMDVMDRRLEFCTAESPMDRMNTATAMVSIICPSRSSPRGDTPN